MKILLPIVLLFVGSTATAQIPKGSVLLGGTLSVDHSVSRNDGPDNNSKSNGFSINPSIGKAIKNNFILGFGVGFGKSRTFSPGYLFLNNGWNVNTYVRKYLPLGSDFNLFAQTSAFYGESKIENEGPNFYDKRHMKIAGLDFFPGLDYAVNRRFHLELSLNDLFRLTYTRTITINSSGGDVTEKSLSANTNLSGTNPIHIGLRFLLSK
jgi:hypothetical protein